MMQTAGSFRGLLVLLTVLLGLTVSARADLSNGDFEFEGADWTACDPVNVEFDAGIAVLYENTDYSYSDPPDPDFDYSSISQTFLLDAADMHLELDFRFRPPDDEPPPPETDYFQVVLGGTVIGIASTDDAAYGDGEWERDYVVPLSSEFFAGDWIPLTFRLKGYDDENETVVEIDNVHLAGGVVPVPGAFLLGGLGLGCAGWRLRRKDS